MINLFENNNFKYDVVVVGAGVSGLTIARQCADNNLKVLLIDKRPTIGGNCYDSIDKNGVLIHNYGPHIFHSFNENIYKYLKKFGPFVKYEHKVLGKIENKFFPIPFNFKSIDIFYKKSEAEELKFNLIKEFKKDSRVTIFDLQNSKNPKIKDLGQLIYKNVFEYYTTKQWGQKPSNISKDTLARIPVVIGNDDTYFPGQIIAMPKESFTSIFEKMVSHKNITLLTKFSFDKIFNIEKGKIYCQGKEINIPIFYSGAIDELFDFKFKELPYRSLNLKFKYLDVNSYQKSAVVNYTVSEDFTRISEFKKLTGQRCKGTTILKEFPQQFEVGKNERFYPINNDKNNSLYQKYFEMKQQYPNLHLIGRLGKYKYFNIDQSIIEAMKDFKKVFPKLKSPNF